MTEYEDLTQTEKQDFIKKAAKAFTLMSDDDVKMTLCDRLRAGGVDHTCLGLPCERCPLHDLEDL